MEGRYEITTSGGTTKLSKLPGRVVRRDPPTFQPMIPVQEQPLNYILYLKNIMNVPEEHIAKNLAHQIWIRDKLLKKRWDEYNDINARLVHLERAYDEKENEVRKLIEREQQYRDYGNAQTSPPLGDMVYNLKI